MKPTDVKNSTYINIYKELNDNDQNVRLSKYDQNVRISKYKIFFAKGYTHGHMLLMMLMVKKLLEHCMKKNCKK